MLLSSTIASHLSTLGERESGERNCEGSENEESENEEGDKSEFEPLAKRPCSPRSGRLMHQFHTLVLYQHFVKIK